MFVKKTIFVSFVCLMFIQQSDASDVIDKSAIPVSLVSLIANPEKYDSKAVRVAGVGWFGFEHSLLCLNFDSVSHNLLSNCLIVGATTGRVTLSPTEILRDYNKVYIEVVAIFSKSPVEEPVRRIIGENGEVREVEYEGLLVGRLDQVNQIIKKPKLEFYQ